MKRLKYQVVVVALLLGAPIGRVQASEPTAGILFPFCTVPILSLCSDPAIAIRDKERESIRTSIQNFAAKAAFDAHKVLFERVGLTYEKIRGPQFMAHALIAGGGFSGMLSIMNTYITATYSKMAGLTLYDESRVAGEIEKIRGYVLEALEDRGDDLGVFRHISMESKIRRTKFVFSSLLPTASRIGDSVFGRLLESFVDVCGVDGMEDNAFAIGLKGDPYIIVCPGKIHAAAAVARETGDGRRFLWSLFRTIAHELSHHVDWDEYPTSYTEFQSCISKHHAARLGVDPERMSAILSIVVENGGEPGKLARDRLATSHKMREISADYWAAEAIARYLGSPDGRGLTEAEKARVLSDGIATSCLRTEGGHHPAGDFRIEVMLRQNPAVAYEMGCINAELYGKPGCDISGAH